jgi:hypothetical protein
MSVLSSDFGERVKRRQRHAAGDDHAQGNVCGRPETARSGLALESPTGGDQSRMGLIFQAKM